MYLPKTSMEPPKKRNPLNRRIREKIIEYSFFFTAITSILVMVLIFYLLIRESLTAFTDVGITHRLFGMKWHSAGNIFGMAPRIVGSITVTLLALIINILVGVPLAIYLSELAGTRSRLILKPAIELLAGVPPSSMAF